MEEKYSNTLLWTVFILILLSITATYYKMVVVRDFVVIDDLDEVTEVEE